MDVWYYSPYPDSIITPDTDAIFICEYCLNYYTDISGYKDHVVRILYSILNC
jgi:hypothetical protein